MVASRQLISAVALGLALTMIGVGCAEDDGLLIGGRPGGTRPGGTSGTGGDTGTPDGNLGGNIGGQESPPPVVASPTPTPTPTPTPPPSESVAFTIPITYGDPRGLAFDGSGNAWVALNGTGGAVKISAIGELLNDYQTGDSPSAVVADPAGNIWVANRAGNTLTKFTAGGAMSQLAVGAGPRDLAADLNGNLWVALEGARSLVKVTISSGATQSIATLAAGGVAVHGGKIWVTDTENNRVAIYDGQGNPDRTIPVGSNPGVIRASSDAVWVLNHSGASLMRIDPATDAIAALGVTGPTDMAIDSSGNAWISSPSTKQVKKYDPSGIFLKSYTIGERPHGLAFAPGGRLWVTDETGHKVHVFVP